MTRTLTHFPVRVDTEPPAHEAPPAERFPAHPASWYYLCRAQTLRARPVGAEVAGRRVAVFRGADGHPAAIDGDCSHMGADLSCGTVSNGRLQCPFHGWEYAANGRCVRIPAQRDVPAFARQRSYAVDERHGLLFAFLGREPLFPLPEFFEPTEAPLIAGRPTRYSSECPWFMFGGNGFDLQHFALVHDRQLVGEPEVDAPAPFARRIRFSSQIVGASAGDRMLRRLLGERVEVSITAWAGNLIAVTARFRRAVSRLLFAASPLEDGRTRADLFVFAERFSPWRRWLQPLSLEVRRMLTTRFVQDDNKRVRRAAYHPGALIEADRAMIDYYVWLASLPQSRKDQS